MNFTLKIWRQKDAKSKGAFESYKVENISADTSFLEMLDILNNNLIHEGKEPMAFDLAAVVVERHGLLALVDQVVVQNIQHLEKRGVGGDVLDFVGFECPFCLGVFLAPYL